LFYEIYLRDKWYNIFEIYDRDDGKLKGWYCNVTYPAWIRRWDIVYRDLALDLLVFHDGTQKVLDVDEFEAIDIPTADRKQALKALDELKAIFQQPTDFRLQRDLVVRNRLI
jgi:protein associated with RNAse G/E